MDRMCTLHIFSFWFSIKMQKNRNRIWQNCTAVKKSNTCAHYISNLLYILLFLLYKETNKQNSFWWWMSMRQLLPTRMFARSHTFIIKVRNFYHKSHTFIVKVRNFYDKVENVVPDIWIFSDQFKFVFRFVCVIIV